MDYQGLVLDYVRSPDQDAPRPVRHPVVVVGAGPVGLSAAIDLAQQGVPVVLLDDDNRLSTGSRAICFAKRTLEIFDRLGCGQRMVDKGVTWNLGKVFFHDEPVYGFNLLPEAGHQRPAFINLQQYYVEGYLFERARALPNLEIRWKHQVTGTRADGGRRVADRRHARRASTGSAATGWSRPTARAARSARPWGWKARAAPSATAS